jgi:hypothetical protein
MRSHDHTLYATFGEAIRASHAHEAYADGAHHPERRRHAPRHSHQFAFARQVQLAADTAKVGAARLAGKEAPSHVDDQKTLEELRARVKSVVAFLDGLTESDFAQGATRTITQPRWEGRTMTGHDYFLEHAVPNFFFHAAHAYAILRHNGVPLGKRDYLGQLTQHAPA